MTASSASSLLRRSLLRANQQILRQKLGLIQALVRQHGPEKAQTTYVQ